MLFQKIKRWHTLSNLKPNNITGDYALINWLFLRGLAIIYFAAFASMAVQIEGLVGANGILPIADTLALIEQVLPEQRFLRYPTIFWFDSSDFMLKAACFTGMAAACLLMFNRAARFALLLCFILYLSISQAGQDFTHFQWDVLLLEAGFLAIFLSWGSTIIVLLYRWLIARFMFMSGVVKIASGDPSWANLTALNYHYQTQPLPTPLAFYAYHLPTWFHKLCVSGVFIIELAIPFFVFLPRQFRLIAAASFVILQISIMLTGNYNYFNLLTVLLCLFLLQDDDVKKVFPAKLSEHILQRKPTPGVIAFSCSGIWAIVVILVCATHIWIYHSRTAPIAPLNSIMQTTSAFSLINNYGLFAVMTTIRNEIIIEGSNDGRHWSEYGFKYKPNKKGRGLGWNIPHQPRLDWQMWFAALQPPRSKGWFARFIEQLQAGSPQVLSLLAENPFPEKPPAYIRASLFRYSYASLAKKSSTGEVWERKYLGVYWPRQ